MLRIKYLPVAFVLIAMMVFGAACASTVNYVDNKDVKVENITDRNIDEFLEVQAVLQNKSKGDVNDSVYRVEWYDSDGMLLETTSWRPIKVKGKVAMHVRERSTKPGAKTYKFVISNQSK